MLVTPDEMRAALDLPTNVTDAALNEVCLAATAVVSSLLRDTDAAGNPIDHTTHQTDREAALAVSGQIWQQRQAPGGAMTGYDLQVANPYLLGPGLVRRVDAMLVACRNPGTLVG